MFNKQKTRFEVKRLYINKYLRVRGQHIDLIVIILLL